MSVSPGQAIKASIVNDAFLSRKTNSSTTGILSLLNTLPESGPAVPNLQETVNTLLTRKAEVETELAAINQSLSEHDTRISDNTSEINLLKGKFNTISAADPTINDDSAAGFAAGSIWKNSTTGKFFFCDDATEGAAIWSEIETGGGSTNAVTTKVSAYAITTDDDIVLCDGTFTITLPAAAGIEKKFTIKNINTGIITVDGGGTETIDGATEYLIENQYHSISVVSNGTGWFIV